MAGISVGEVEATLRLRDEMTASLQKAQQAAARFGTQAAIAFDQPKANIASLEAQLRSARQEVDDVNKAFAGIGPGANGLQLFQSQMEPATRKVQELEAALAQAKAQMAQTSTTTVQASNSWETLGAAATKAGTALRSIGTTLSLTLTAPIVATAAAAEHFAAGFETQMTRVQTLAGASAAEVAAMKDRVLELGPATGIGPEALAKGLFVAESAMFHGTEAMKILTTSAHMSAIGMGEAEETTRALVGVMLSYQQQNLSAAEAGDIFVKTVQLGNMRIDELVPALARVNPLAAAMGLKFQDVTAAIASFTHIGASTEIAATGLRAILNNILNDSVKTERGFASLAKATGDTSISMDNFVKAIKEKGLAQALVDLVEKANQAGDASVNILHDIFPNIRALTEVLAIAKANGTMYIDIAKKMGDTTGELDRAFAQTRQTFNQQWAEFKAQAEALWISLGEALLPTLKDLVVILKDDVLPAVKRLVDEFKQAPQEVKTFTIGLGAFLAALGPLTFALGGVSMAIAGVSNLMVALPAIGTAATGAVTAFTSGSLGMVAISGGVLALAAAFGALGYAAGRLADIVSGGKLSAWLTPYISGSEELALVTQANAAQMDELAAASKRSGRAITDLTEARKINKGWTIQSTTTTKDNTTATNDSTKAHQTVLEAVKNLTAEERASIQTKKAQGESIAAIAKETGTTTEVVATYLRQIKSTTVGENQWEKSVSAMTAAITGETPKVYELLDAWNRLTPEQQANETNIKNMVEQYGKMRVHLAPDALPFALEEVYQNTVKLNDAHAIWNTNISYSLKAVPDVSEQLTLANSRINELTTSQYDWNGALSDTYVVHLPKLVSSLEHVPTAMDGLKASLKDTLGGLAETFEHAFEGDGGLSGALRSLGVQLGKDFAKALTNSIKESLKMGGTGGGSSTMGSAAGMGALMGLGAASSGASLGSQAGSAVVGGVGVGIQAASMGASLATSVATAAMTMGVSLAVIGAVALIKYMIRDKMPKDIARDAGEKFGQEWSKGLSDTVLANAKKFHDEVTGELASLPEIIKEHPIDASNVEMYTGKVRDLFVAIGTGHMTTKQAVSVLNDVFPELAAASTDASGRVSAGLKDIIGLSEQYGAKSQAIAAWQAGQGQQAITGFVAAMDGAAVATKQDLTDLGLEAIAAFTAAVAAGVSETEALKAIGPSLAKLQQDYKDLGFDVEDVGLKALMMESQILSAAPQLAAGIAGITQEMIALDNLGLMNVEQFEAMERTGYGMFVQLQAQAAALGGTSKDALIPMQGWLHEAAKEAELLGVPLDANTQMLIDQSKELGIWKESGKSATDKLVDGMTKLVDKVGELVDRLNGVSTSIGNIPKDFTVTGHFRKDDDFPDDAHSMAAGGAGRATGPTLFYTAGNEDFAFSGEGRRFGDVDFGGRERNVSDKEMLNELQIMNLQFSQLPGVLVRMMKAAMQQAMAG